MVSLQRHLPFLLFVALLQLEVVSSLEANLKREGDRRLIGAVLGTLNRIPDCYALLLFDDAMLKTEMDLLVEGINLQDRVIQILELSSEQFDKHETTDPAEIIQIYLNRLYRNGKCYAFIVWVKDPSVLYVDSINIHPGWRKQDYVLIPVHDSTSFTYKEIIDLRIWKEIPNLIALRKKEIKPTRIHVFTVHPHFKDGVRRAEELDSWRVKQKVFEKNATLFKDKFAKFNGGVLNFGYIWKLPFFIWGDRENPYIDGLDLRLTRLAFDRLGYKHSEKQITGRAGMRLENGTWTGLMGHLMNGEIDIAIGGIIITPQRLEDFDFCRTYYTDAYTFISPLKLSTPSVWSAITKPLSVQVWVVTGIAAVFATFCMKFLALAERKLKIQYHDESRFVDHHFTQLAVNIGFLFCAFCQKPTYYVPKSAPLKFAYTGISFSLIILGIVFGARMFSIILIKGPDTSIDSIEELERSGLQIDMKDYEEYLIEYLGAKHANLFKKMNPINQTSAFDSIDEVVKGNRIFIDARSSLDFTGRYYYKLGKAYKFHLSSEDLLSGNIGWTIRKNWPYRDAFDRLIMAAVESGLIQYWMSHFKRGSFGWDDEAWKVNLTNPHLTDRVIRVDEFDPTSNSDRRDFKLRLDNVFGIGMIWVVGLSFACVVFICELILGWTRALKSLTKTWCDRDASNKRGSAIINKEENDVLTEQLNRTLQKKAPNLPAIMWTDFTTTKSLNRRNRSRVEKLVPL